MSEPILHHYDTSPYSEKIRAIFGYKRMAWRSVTTPAVAPKPDLVALTGGYRRAPVLQVGRDIYCDTRLIVRVLDRLQPAPPVVPPRQRLSCLAYASLEQTLFFATVPVVFQPAGLKYLVEQLGPDAMQQFRQDREALFAGGTARRPNAEYSRLNFVPLFNAVDVQLGDGPYLLGAEPTLADFVCYHCAWFVLRNPGTAPLFEPFRNLLAWAQRMQQLGHGHSSPMSGAAALDVARQAQDEQPFEGPLLEPEGLKLGQRVAVNATDYGCEPVVGTLAHASVYELALRRADERAGEVTVHFPREGFSAAAVA
ncbi:MAG: glutathione S-transferase family protein [Nevskia sp.]|nr:glutathione S-transferase family protein [Nevskia sp.]